MSKKLEISLLGPPIVRSNAGLISIPRRVPRALLYYLAWQGAMVPRETLLDLFWEGEISAGRARLTETVSRLAASLPGTNLLIRRDGQIGLDLEQVYVDRLHFETLVAQAGQVAAQIAPNEPLPNDIVRLLNQANDLWRGVWAFQGASFHTAALDNWMQQAAERLQCLRFTILVRLSDHAVVLRDFQGALDYARIAQEYEPYNGDLHIRVLQNMLKLGLSEEARAYYESTRRMLDEDLGLQPSPRLTEIYRKISKPDDTSVIDTDPKWELHPSVEVPFVGRNGAILKIHQIIERGRAVVILGESGQGKSRLMQEFINQFHPQPRVLLAVCRPMESLQPFQPFVELFRRYTTEEEWQLLSPIWVNYLVSLLPELAEIRPDLSSFSLPENLEYSQEMIFESIRQVLLVMCAKWVCFLVIDDAHWADEATLATLAYLLGRAPFDQLAILALIARTEDLTTSFNNLVIAIQQSRQASVLTLQHLQREDICALTQYVLNIEPSEQFLNQLMADSGGNTFFVLEILRAMMGATNIQNTLPLTQNLQNLILMRIQRVEPESKETLQVAALIGSEFSLDVLEKVCLKTPAEMAPILEEMENSLLIAYHSHAQGKPTYHFSHEKIRETLLQLIHPARARVLHERILQVLLKQPLPEQASVLAQHYSGAGELMMAFRYWIKAAERARKLFSKEDASLSYERAEMILRQIEPQLSSKEIYQFYADWNDLAYNTTETHLLKHIGNELIRIGEKRSSPLLIGSGLDSLSDACMTENDFMAGLEYTHEAIEYLGKISNCFELVEAFNHRGTFLYMLNRLQEAHNSFQNALMLSSGIHDHRINKALSNTHYQIALLELLFGKPILGHENGVKAFEYAQVSQHSYSIIQAYGIQSLTKFYLGEFAEARDNALKGIELAERIQGWRMLGYLNTYAAIAEVGLGHLDAARQHAESAVEIGQKYQQYDVATLGYRGLGEIHRMLQDYPCARDYYQKGFDGSPKHFLGFDNLYRLGLVENYLGIPNGIEQIIVAQNVVKEFSIGIGIITSKLCLALAYADQNEWQKARQLAAELESETFAQGMKSYHTSSVCLLAEAAIAEGDLETALARLQEVTDETRFAHNPWGEIKVQAILERLLSLRGEVHPQPGQQIEARLQQIEARISHPKTRVAFAGFQDQILKRTQVATDLL